MGSGANWTPFYLDCIVPEKHPLAIDIEGGNFIFGLASETDHFPSDIADVLSAPNFDVATTDLPTASRAFVAELLRCDGLNLAQTTGFPVSALR
ncbi:MAG: hypothetical protein AAF386_14195, partial [Pseudomonadota bacterium]